MFEFFLEWIVPAIALATLLLWGSEKLRQRRQQQLRSDEWRKMSNAYRWEKRGK